MEKGCSAHSHSNQETEIMETVVFALDIALWIMCLLGLVLSIWWLVTVFRAGWQWLLFFIIGPPGVLIFGVLAEMSGVRFAFLAAFLSVLAMPFVFLKKHWEIARKPFICMVVHFFLTIGLSVAWAGALYKAEVNRVEAEGEEAEFDSFGGFVMATWALAREEAIEKRAGGGEEADSGEAADKENAEASGETNSTKLAANPKGRLGKIMAAVDADLEIAEKRAAESSEIVEKTAAIGEKKVEATAPVESEPMKKAAEPKKTEESEKAVEAEPAPKKAAEPEKSPEPEKTASPSKGEGAAAKSGYARAPKNLRVVSILGGSKRKTALINDGAKNHMVVKGDNLTLEVAGAGRSGVEIVDIVADAVVIKLDGRATPMAINAPKE